jgi:translation elongation factor EF-1beta/GTPase SAR1 family protein
MKLNQPFHSQHILVKENIIFSKYYAPRGRQRLFLLASELSQRYLYASDLLIAIIGSEGSGKSTLIKGLFPGLELTNDDDGVNLRPAPLFTFSPDDFFSGHTFHVDIRYESAFHQPWEIVNAVNSAIEHNRRVVIEHFDLIYEHLGYNAQVIFGIGEDVIVSRPNVFGPHPGVVKKVVDKTIEYRLMAHSAEDITSFILLRDYGYTRNLLHSDVKHGFVIFFPEEPDINIQELERKVEDVIEKDIPIQPSDENHITIGEDKIYCTGIRTHVKSSGKIKNFRLFREYKYDPIAKEYMLIGIVGGKISAELDELEPELD